MVKLTRLAAGISLLGASVWLAPVIADFLGTDHLFGFVTVGMAVCFAAGAVFFSGMRRGS